jgi:hypothetical protein
MYTCLLRAQQFQDADNTLNNVPHYRMPEVEEFLRVFGPVDRW